MIFFCFCFFLSIIETKSNRSVWNIICLFGEIILFKKDSLEKYYFEKKIALTCILSLCGLFIRY